MRSPLLAHHIWLVVILSLGGVEPFAITSRRESTSTTARVRDSRRSIDLQSSAGTGDANDVAGASSPSWYHFTERDCEVDEVDSFISRCDAIVATVGVASDEVHEMWARPCHVISQGEIDEGILAPRRAEQHAIAGVPKEAIDAIDATHRWSSNFVRGLQLCPWAGASLDTPGAVRYWMLVVEDGENDNIDQERKWAEALGGMERLVQLAGRQLKRITSPSMTEEGADPIDPSVAISFVVLVDKQSGRLPDFGTFHEFFLELEDRLLDECDDFWDNIDDDDSEDSAEDGDAENVPLGCDITIAAFHPQWQFGDGGDGNCAENDQAIDYEKRTPYPTISIVVSSAIDALMSQDENGDADVERGWDGALDASAPATMRIAAKNQQTLEGIGVKRLKEIFETEVVRCPLDHDKLT